MTDATAADVVRLVGWVPLLLMLLGALTAGYGVGWVVFLCIEITADVLADAWRIMRGRS